MSEQLQQLKWKKFKVLDDGFVCLVDVMGDDSSIVQAARVSYGDGTKRVNDDRNLIRYLMRHRHSTPFEMAELKFAVRVPMDCWRQWVRHRTANINEYSTRYSEAIDSASKTASDAWRMQSKTNNQGSGETIDEQLGGKLSEAEQNLLHMSRYVYKHRLMCGVAREQARKDLPLSTYTEAYWKIDLHNLLHFLSLRMDQHAQYEIRQYAITIGEQIVKPLFPVVWEAFEDYRLHGMFLTSMDIQAVANFLRDKSANQQASPESAVQFIQNNRERNEALDKLNRIVSHIENNSKGDHT
jgi:thymidylate synthase (FAD)